MPRSMCLSLVLLLFGCAGPGRDGEDASAGTAAPDRIQGAGQCLETLRTFGTMGKEGKLHAGTETVLLEHEGAGSITHMWFGGDWPGYDKTVLRVYVDSDEKPAIEAELFHWHGIGWGDPAAPWGNELVGKTGHPSGLYSTIRIPFGERIRVTATLGDGVQGPQTFWWIVRGVENLPVEIGGIRLPARARLALIRSDRVKLDPLVWIILCQVKGRGALYGVFMEAASKNFNYLETCLRAYIDGAKEPLWLSSGTEDYFLGTYYFNRGPYRNPIAGLTHKSQSPEGGCRFSAYRFHDRDPIFFHRDLRLLWRNGEEIGGHVFGSPQETELTSYVWVYTW